MTIKTRQKIERQIARQVVRSALECGFTVSVLNGGDSPEISKSSDFDKIVGVMFATDEEVLKIYHDDKFVGAVQFVYGNDGWDVIADYHTILEPILKKALALADKFADSI